MRLRQVADKCGAVLMCDMAQISGLVAAKVKIWLLIFCCCLNVDLSSLAYYLLLDCDFCFLLLDWGFYVN